MWYLTNSDELQIKIAQGAKPGEGEEPQGVERLMNTLQRLDIPHLS